jgi:phosphatidate cytidylyltransferase
MITKNLKKRFFTSSLLFLLIFLLFNSNIILVFSLLILSVLSLLEFFSMTNKIYKNFFYLLATNTFFIIYVSLFCFFFFYFSNVLQFKILLFSLLCACAASDIGGFFFGKIFKGPKLTRISPKKTLSGAFGSLIITSIVFSIMVLYFTKNFNYKILILSFIISISCQLGDLFFSFLKRKAKIKDTGKFFPGHGGVLDRLDGIFLGIPTGFISTLIIY